MKVIILHGTSSNSQSNWFPWLKSELEKNGWDVWVPDLPEADNPNIKRYNKYILENLPWPIDEETVLIGHSSGSVALLGLLPVLPKNYIANKCILIGSFKDDLSWENLGGLFEEPFDFEAIKKRSLGFLFIHSDDDPYCPLDHARFLSEQLHGELKVIPGQKHFSAETDPKYTSFPQLRDILLA